MRESEYGLYVWAKLPQDCSSSGRGGVPVAFQMLFLSPLAIQSGVDGNWRTTASGGPEVLHHWPMAKVFWGGEFAIEVAMVDQGLLNPFPTCHFLATTLSKSFHCVLPRINTYLEPHRGKATGGQNYRGRLSFQERMKQLVAFLPQIGISQSWLSLVQMGEKVIHISV